MIVIIRLAITINCDFWWYQAFLTWCVIFSDCKHHSVVLAYLEEQLYDNAMLDCGGRRRTAFSRHASPKTWLLSFCHVTRVSIRRCKCVLAVSLLFNVLKSGWLAGGQPRSLGSLNVGSVDNPQPPFSRFLCKRARGPLPSHRWLLVIS